MNEIDEINKYGKFIDCYNFIKENIEMLEERDLEYLNEMYKIERLKKMSVAYAKVKNNE